MSGQWSMEMRRSGAVTEGQSRGGLGAETSLQSHIYLKSEFTVADINSDAVRCQMHPRNMWFAKIGVIYT